ncbi:YkvA family protein [Ramlibacter sp. AN1015]|uniref:YkvA family protein n=1 Tax=Ramlibacter sp. AN1015 TaxID=3133428 RepID=UPI0030C64A16
MVRIAGLGQRLRQWAARIKRDGVTLWFALRHPDTPWPAKALAFLVVAYALSPIDLIPDMIPVLGYVDDVLLLPVLIWLAVRLVPPLVLTQCRARADEWLVLTGRTPTMWQGALLVFAVWLALGLALWFWLEPGRLGWWG